MSFPTTSSGNRTPRSAPTTDAHDPAELLDSILASQRPDGAFPSRVLLDRRSGLEAPDGNAFVTALVTHHLLALPADLVRATGFCGKHVGAIERALDFLEHCRASNPPGDARSNGRRGWGRDIDGAFRFYPENARPEWMQTRLAPDVDDTVLSAGVLLAAGRMERGEAVDLVERVLEPHRLHDRAAAARWPWVEAGAYKTWIDPKLRPNPVDCTVNANAAALLARLDLRDHPAYRAAVATVRRGVEWAAGSPAHGRSISPFYPDLTELGHAIERAREAGVEAFEDLPLHPSAPSPGDDGDHLHHRDRPVCSSADGRVQWIAPVLQTAREIAGPAGALGPRSHSINPSIARGTLS